MVGNRCAMVLSSTGTVLPLGRVVELAQVDRLVQGRRADTARAEEEDEAADGVGVVVESPVACSHVAHGYGQVKTGMPQREVPLVVGLVDVDPCVLEQRLDALGAAYVGGGGEWGLPLFTCLVDSEADRLKQQLEALELATVGSKPEWGAPYC